MAAQPASTVPTISPAEMQILISRAGLVLNPGQMADLVLAWRQVAGLIAAIPQGRKLADDMALTFRLPPPDASGAVAPPVTKAPVREPPQPASKRAAKPPRKAARPATSAKAKAKKRKAPRRPTSRNR